MSSTTSTKSRSSYASNTNINSKPSPKSPYETSSSSGNVPIYAITGLSHIISVSKACEILGESTVRHLVKSFLRCIASSARTNVSSNRIGRGAVKNTRASQNSTGNNTTDKYNDIPFQDMKKALDPHETEDEKRWVDLLTKALLYDFNSNDNGSSVHENGDTSASKADSLSNNSSTTKSTSQRRSISTAPDWVSTAWHRMLNFPTPSTYTNLTMDEQQQLSSLNAKIPFPLLGLDKTTFVRSGVIFPSCMAPHAGQNGHLALMECVFYALATPPTTVLTTRLAKVANAVPKSGVGRKEWRDYCRREYSKAMVDGPIGSDTGSESFHNSRNMNNQRTLLLLPDLMIFWSIVKRYNDLFVDSGSNIEGITARNLTVANQQEGKENNMDSGDNNQELLVTNEGEQAILAISRLTYRVYDAFQKKGTISRDSIHRFLSDIHGEEMHKKPTVKQVLDRMFTTDSESVTSRTMERGNDLPSRTMAHLNEAQYIKAARKTVAIISGGADCPNRLEHVLFDWFNRIGNSILPEFLWDLDEFYSASFRSVGVGTLLQAKYDMIQIQTTDIDLQKLYQKFAISAGGSESMLPSTQRKSFTNPPANHMSLFEVKRRFQSIIKKGIGIRKESVDDVIEGDQSDSSSSASSSIEEEGHHLPIEEEAGETVPSKASLSRSGDLPKNAIDDDVFVRTISDPDEDMGHGGFITPKLAKLLFRAGCIKFKKDRQRQSFDSTLDALLNIGADNIADRREIDGEKLDYQEKNYWDMFDVLSFGCNSVRGELVSEDGDEPLLELIFFMFTLLPSSDKLGRDVPQTIDTGRSSSDKTPNEGGDNESLFLDKMQVAHMILLLLEHYSFRLQADSPRNEDNSLRPFYEVESDVMRVKVDVSIAALLGLLPKSIPTECVTAQGSNGKTVCLKKLVDQVFAEGTPTNPGTNIQEHFFFENFITWYKASRNTNPSLKIGSLITDMRLIGSIVFGVKPYMPSTEKVILDEVRNRFKYRYATSETAKRGPLGTTWYIIHAQWWKEWQKYAQEGRHLVLPAISNDRLLVSNGSLALRIGLRFRHDYELLPPLAWSALQGWHDEGPPISRTVTPFHHKGPLSDDRNSHVQYEIELHPIFVTILLSDSSSRGESRPFQQFYPVSRYLPLQSLLDSLCKSLGVDAGDGRLWMTNSRSIMDLNLNFVQHLKQEKIIHSEDDITSRKLEVVLELKGDRGEWPTSQKETQNDRNESDEINTSSRSGIVGLHNMGNTCYMNSSIQCLSHTPILRDYFTSKSYLNDINRTNPMGYEGHLAQVSAVLFNHLWRQFSRNKSLGKKKTGSNRHHTPLDVPCITPKTFKDTLGRLNEDFAGNEQHDAQELLNFLLSGLSEDLNRIVNKPYTEAPDSDGRPDKELADIWWNNHLKREMSIIVALFNGQYKSLLTCQNCEYESARFEPFCSIEVPLPEDDQVTVQLVYFPMNESAVAMKYAVRVRHDGKLFDVLLALAKVLYEEGKENSNPNSEESKPEDADIQEIYQTTAKDMTVVRLETGYIANIQPESWNMDKIYNKDTGEIPLLFVYQLDPRIPEEKEKNDTGREENKKQIHDETTPSPAASLSVKYSFLALCQRRAELTHSPFLHYWYQKVFGTPFILRVADLEGYTGRDLYDLVAERVKPYVPEKALKFLSHDFDDNEDLQEGRNIGDSGKLRKGRRQRFNKTCAGSHTSAFGKMPRYGFRLRVTSREGKKCEVCPWYECCSGCLITDDDYPTIAMCGDTIVIDWHIGVDLSIGGFESLTSGAEPRGNMLSNVKKHKTCHAGKNRFDNITLDDCLDAFIKEERIPDTYCSRCKELRVQKKAMSLWRLPPVMIITLKRFQFTERMKRKLRDYVHFPVEGLDFSRIVASDGDVTQSSVGDKQGKSKHDKGASSKHDNTLRPDIHCGRKESLYDLYAVIHHQGALTGGHYVASLRSEVDGKWRLFNDAAVYEVSAKDVVDASAYILFYVRRDVKNASLEDFWDTQPREGEGMTEEEVEKMMKQRERCVIS